MLDASLSPFSPASDEYRQKTVIDVIHRREESRKRIEAASRPLTVEEVRREQPDFDGIMEEDEIMELPIAIAARPEEPMDEDAPPVPIIRTEVKEEGDEGDDEEEPAPEAEAAEPVLLRSKTLVQGVSQRRNGMLCSLTLSLRRATSPIIISTAKQNIGTRKWRMFRADWYPVWW